jgi:hypothetical protein
MNARQTAMGWHLALQARSRPMNVYASILWIDLLHNAERSDFNVGRTPAKHSLNCDSIAWLDAIPQLCLGGLLLIGPSEKPIPSSDKDL